MKKIILSLAAALMLAATAAKAAENINISTVTDGAGAGWSFASATLTLTGGDYAITGGIATESCIVVQSGATANITLEDVNIDVGGAYGACAFAIASGAAVKLTLRGSNTLKSGSTKAGLQVPSGATLEITAASSGSLAAVGGNGGAGIGGGFGGSGGNITIAGGVVAATGSSYGAGIGGGDGDMAGGAGGAISISGGTVAATGGNSGAGIGGGFCGSSGAVSISGGTVAATAGANGAGIGSGEYGSGGAVTITGGSVKASNSSGPQPTNGEGSVYLNTLTVGSPAVASTAIAAGSIGGAEGYGVHDVATDGEGKLYLYLPATVGDEAVQLTVAAGHNFGSAYTRAAAHNNAQTLPLQPFVVATLDDLKALSETPSMWDKHYVQAADIEASATAGWSGGKGFSPIGNVAIYFTGSYNGQGHTIAGLTISGAADFVGLFGYVSSCTIENVGMVGGSITGRKAAGGVVGYASNNSTVRRCYATGNVSGSYYVGGVAGYTSTGNTVSCCYATGTVAGAGSVGGVVGWSENSAVSRCYATGAVAAAHYAGGVVGYNDNGSAITASIAVQRSIPAVGGGEAGDAALISEAQLKALATFTTAGWGVNGAGEAAWAIDDGLCYPYLAWQPSLSNPAATVSGISASYPYTGAAHEPVPTAVVHRGKPLSPATDYTLRYGSNTTIAEGGSVVVIGKGIYGGGVEKTFTIAKASAALTIAQASITYGETLDPQVVSQTGNGAVTYEYKLQREGADAYSATAPRSAGRYTVRGNAAATCYYEAASSVGVDFSIAAKPITVTVASQADVAYGTAVSPCYGHTALADGDSFTGALAIDGSRSTSGCLAAGSHSITQGDLAIADGNGGSYALTFVGDTFTVSPLALAHNVAAAAAKVYDGADAAAHTGGLTNVVAGDRVALSAALRYTEGKNVQASGSIGASAWSISGDDAESYRLPPFAAQAASITARPITITVAKQADVAYGAAVSPCYGHTALADGDKLTGALSIGGSRSTSGCLAAGSHSIVRNTLAIADGNGGGNYALTFIGETFTVSPLALTVAGIAFSSKPYDGTTSATACGAPALSGAVVSGDAVWLNSDGVSYAFSAEATGTSTVLRTGSYALSGADAGCYTLTQPATSFAASISAAEQSISFAPDAALSVKGGSYALHATATSGLPVLFRLLHTEAASLSGNLLTLRRGGSITVIAYVAPDGTYSAAPEVPAAIELLLDFETYAWVKPDGALAMNMAQLAADSYSVATYRWYKGDAPVGDPSEDLAGTLTPGEAYRFAAVTDNGETLRSTAYTYATPTTGVGANRYDALHVYPTLTGGLLSIACEQRRTGDRANVYTLLGAAVATYPLTGSITTISLAQLPAGAYIVKVGSKAAKVLKK